MELWPQHNAKQSLRAHCLGGNSDDIMESVVCVSEVISKLGRTTDSHPWCRLQSYFGPDFTTHVVHPQLLPSRRLRPPAASAFSLEATITGDPTTRLLARSGVVLAIDPLLVIEVVLTLSQRMIALVGGTHVTSGSLSPGDSQILLSFATGGHRQSCFQPLLHLHMGFDMWTLSRGLHKIKH